MSAWLVIVRILPFARKRKGVKRFYTSFPAFLSSVLFGCVCVCARAEI